MKVLYDINVVLDVFQHREPHYASSALAINASLENRVTAFFPAHAVPTVDYIVRKYATPETAASAVGWLLDRFENSPYGLFMNPSLKAFCRDQRSSRVT